MAGPVSRFLGDSPLRVILKLLVVSFIVGFVMNMFGWSPLDVWYALREAVLDVWHLGFEAFGRFAGYIVLGAAIVIPAFIVLRLLSFRR
ncbi:DUF6460 domain-containing protein [Aquibium oceanicum]|uniref:DUF6460 domain-containing protein n=1 Tax=Aquibium oceanicum TaxID=1670800 RepID=A0A1L3SZD0_9HYPH|nr:DUF6460 domain-containing protein [Aquibium oceanicum]APH74714.1 hypothetical protein BSQ44_19620 [Aquibium oceanicum]